MASTQKYLNHLLQRVGITPACSEEERTAAELIASIFRNHGFEPQIQEFSASSMPKLVQAGLGIALFLGVVLIGIGGAIGVVGFLLTVAVAVIFTLERNGRPVFSQMGNGGLSQNVIAYHKAAGPMASPRNRPVVVVAHYDSPRADFLSQMPFAPYRPLLAKALPYAMVAPAIVAVISLLPLPGAIKIILWLLSLAASLVPLASAAAIIANRFVLPYTTGSVCNKSSVASLLGVMDAVSPFEGEDEFPGDQPFDEYMAAQAEIAAAASVPEEPAFAADEEDLEGDLLDAPGDEAAPSILPAPSETQAMDADEIDDALHREDAAEEAEDASLPVHNGDAGSTRAMAAEDLQEADGDAPEPEANADPASELPVNAAGNLRYGADVIRSLGMVAPSCKIEYEEEPAPDPFNAPVAPETVQPVDETDRADETEDAWEDDEAPSAEDDLAVPAAIADLASEPVEEAPLEEEAEAELELAEEAVADPMESEVDPVEDEADDAAPEGDAPVSDDGGTQVFTMPAADEPSSTREIGELGSTQVYRPVETVDSLMAQIDAKVPGRVKPTARQIPPVVPDASALQGRGTGNRSSLFDVPDPSATPNDPFASASESPTRKGFTVIGPNDPIPVEPTEHEEASAAPAPEPVSAASEEQEEKPLRGLARFFGRKKKKKQQDSMSDWLGVDDEFDAKKTGGEIGSWDNFGSDDDSWKGGATGSDYATDDELRDAIASLGDDELLGHDIWFVATGASESGNAGIKAFLETHRDKLRGVFLINLESIGAGNVSIVSTEGESRVLKGDRRIMNLVNRVSQDFHRSFGTVDLPFMDTDAHAAMEMSLRSLTLAGVDATHLACSHSEEDQPYNVDAENVQAVADVVTEVIRRS